MSINVRFKWLVRYLAVICITASIYAADNRPAYEQFITRTLSTREKMTRFVAPSYYSRWFERKLEALTSNLSAAELQRVARLLAEYPPVPTEHDDSEKLFEIRTIVSFLPLGVLMCLNAFMPRPNDDLEIKIIADALPTILDLSFNVYPAWKRRCEIFIRLRNQIVQRQRQEAEQAEA